MALVINLLECSRKMYEKVTLIHSYNMHNNNIWRFKFVDIFDLINTSVLTHEYGLHKIPKLTHFLFLDLNVRKIKECC
jgi:hypothetical protein